MPAKVIYIDTNLLLFLGCITTNIYFQFRLKTRPKNLIPCCYRPAHNDGRQL